MKKYLVKVVGCKEREIESDSLEYLDGRLRFFNRTPTHTVAVFNLENFQYWLSGKED